uniref:Uncharacterized protein n=1 Tax=Arundo donax TaxID=35708 RepID=A0A0A9B024_ARUDO
MQSASLDCCYRVFRLALITLLGGLRSILLAFFFVRSIILLLH